jgi:hypothetical protein
MAIYGKKYTLEFDDVIEGEFNDYRLEIFKKYEVENISTADNVYITAGASVPLAKGDPVFIQSNGQATKAKASTSSLMPAIGIAYEDISYGDSGLILISGYVDDLLISLGNAYVGENGGLTNTTTGLTQVQLLGIQQTASKFILFDQEVTLKGTGTPIKLTYNLTDNDILSPFRSSYLDISFYKESLSDDFSELFAAESDAFKVYLYKNDILFWQGWIGTQLFSEPFASPPYPLNIRAYDGLNLLKNIPYFDDVEVFQATSNLFNDRYGYHNIVDVVEKCIYNTGVLGDIYYCVNVKNSEYVEDSKFFVSRTRVHHQTFLKGESNSMNMEEVLGMVLRSLGATIYQRDGDWCFIKISDFTLTSTPSILKRSVWRADTVPTATNYITTTEGTGSTSKVSNNINFFQIDNSSTMTIQYPLKEVTIEQEFDHDMITETTIDSVRDLGADDPSGLYLFTEWETDGSDIQEAVVLRKNETLGESRQLPKSFIEADLNAVSLLTDYCDPSLSYPVSHECTIDSSKITGVKASAKARPLGRSLVQSEALSIMFSPKLSYTSGGVLSETGFGRSYYYQSSMINRKILRMNLDGLPPVGGGAGRPDGVSLKKSLLIVSVSPNNPVVSPSPRWQINVYQNGFLHFTQNITVPQFQRDYIFGGGYDSGGVNFTTPYTKWDLFENDYTVEFIALVGNPEPLRFEWYLQGNNEADNYEVSWVSMPENPSGVIIRATTDNFKFAEVQPYPWTQTQVFKDGGNFGTTKPRTDSNNTTASVFRKSFDCNTSDWLATNVQTDRINDWTEFSITGTENWKNDISSLKLNMHIFGGAKTIDSDASGMASPYTDTYDVSFTDIKLLPLISNYTFAPKKQEYILTQSGNFSNKLTKKVKIGSGLFNVGSKRYITFNSEAGSNAMKSWNTFSDARGFSGYGVEDSTMQHLVAACYMELYRVSVRRLDGNHYGNYKYGDKLQPIVGGSVETLNGSTGKFFPMNVVMDLRMARTSFSGDDLMDNTGTTWQSTLTKSIKWIGDNGITETETLS